MTKDKHTKPHPGCPNCNTGIPKEILIIRICEGTDGAALNIFLDFAEHMKRDSLGHTITTEELDQNIIACLEDLPKVYKESAVPTYRPEDLK